MMFVNDLYLGCALVACFDGDEGAGSGDGGAGDAGGAGAGAGAGTGTGNQGSVAGNGGGERTFTQTDINKMLAEDRRKHQTQLQKVEQTYKEVLANNKSLSDQERKTLEENLSVVQGQLRTKEHQLQIEKKELEEAYQGKLTEAQKKIQEWENRYRESTVARALQDAAVNHDAFRPEQIVTLLRPMTRLVEDVDPKTNKANGLFKPMVDFDDIDGTTGDSIQTTRTPEEAVKRMKELPEIYGNLFKSNIVSGIGAHSATGGLTPGANGRIDVKRLTPQQYREIREKNPELLGLRSNGRRR